MFSNNELIFPFLPKTAVGTNQIFGRAPPYFTPFSSARHHDSLVLLDLPQRLVHHERRVYPARHPHRQELPAASALLDLHLRLPRYLATAHVADDAAEVIQRGVLAEILLPPADLEGVIRGKLREGVHDLTLLVLGAGADGIVLAAHGPHGDVEAGRAKLVQNLAGLRVHEVAVLVEHQTLERIRYELLGNLIGDVVYAGSHRHGASAASGDTLRWSRLAQSRPVLTHQRRPTVPGTRERRSRPRVREV